MAIARLAAGQPLSTQDAVNATAIERMRAMGERVRVLEDLKAGERLSVLENELPEVKWLVRGVTVAVLGQLVMAVFSDRKQSVKP